ncbi:glucokinase [Prolixibacter bellariivorans]|uniref:Glucokinase n=1 Tax=Prolixibacter bellariivorans TaxID=314319 RepID=A0A5M4B602_9BACT|nr:ROK family protein [Prolixibacter bellariivorans]GET35167.1 glucokinase [Prolixibacter bellariivorans]
MSVIGIDLGGTKLISAIFSEDGEILDVRKVLLHGKKGNEVSELMQSQLKSLLTIGDSSADQVRAVGISVPGIYNAGSGTVWVPNIDGWDNYPLLSELSETIGGRKIDIEVAGDRACYILGETWKGKARGCQNAIFLAVGTGIGAGIMIDGEVVKGPGGIAGAVGWLALNKPYEDKYIPCGCFEYYASGDGLTRYANELLSLQPDYSGMFRTREVNAYNLFCAYDDSDEIAVQVIDNAIEYWGMAVANLVSILNPEVVIFGGGVFGEAVRFLDKIYQEAVKWGQPIAMKQVRLEASWNAEMAGLYGAAKLAIGYDDNLSE